MQEQVTASFTPVTVTAETLRLLSKEKDYANLLALYMACVEVAAWQKDSSIKATRSFMMKRLSWGEKRLGATKAKLVELGLLENITRVKGNGQVEGHYVLVKYIIHTPSESRHGFEHGMVFDRTNANKQNISANKQKQSAGDFEEKKSEKLEKLIEIVNPREKPTQERQRMLNARLKDYTFEEIKTAAKAFSQSEWHKQNKQMSIDNLLAPSKFGRWYTTGSSLVDVEDATARSAESIRQSEEEAARIRKKFGGDL